MYYISENQAPSAKLYARALLEIKRRGKAKGPLKADELYSIEVTWFLVSV